MFIPDSTSVLVTEYYILTRRNELTLNIAVCSATSVESCLCLKAPREFPSALDSIGRPEFYHFLYNPTKGMFAIQACGMDAEGANRVPKKNRDDRYEIKSKNLVRLIYQSCGRDRTRSYRLPGVEYPQQRLVNYDLCHAIPIFEGKMDKENESTQEPVQAASEAENS